MTEQELARRAKRRLAVLRRAEEITGNVAPTCRYYGISRQVFYKWRRRYDAHGLDGWLPDPAGNGLAVLLRLAERSVAHQLPMKLDF